jgi:hypothetical protein
MLTWLIRLIMTVSAGIVGWFVSRDAANFSVLQLAMLLLLMAALIAIAAFWAVLGDRIKEMIQR